MEKSRKNLGSDEALTYTPILKIASDKIDVVEVADKNEYVGETYKSGNPALFFDKNTGNFHIMPKEARVLNDCEEAIAKKYSEIAEKLDEKLKKKTRSIGIGQDQNALEKEKYNIKIYLIT